MNGLRELFEELSTHIDKYGKKSEGTWNWDYVAWGMQGQSEAIAISRMLEVHKSSLGLALDVANGQVVMRTVITEHQVWLSLQENLRSLHLDDDRMQDMKDIFDEWAEEEETLDGKRTTPEQLQENSRRIVELQDRRNQIKAIDAFRSNLHASSLDEEDKEYWVPAIDGWAQEALDGKRWTSEEFSEKIRLEIELQERLRRSKTIEKLGKFSKEELREFALSQYTVKEDDEEFTKQVTVWTAEQLEKIKKGRDWEETLIAMSAMWEMVQKHVTKLVIKIGDDHCYNKSESIQLSIEAIAAVASHHPPKEKKKSRKSTKTGLKK